MAAPRSLIPVIPVLALAGFLAGCAPAAPAVSGEGSARPTAPAAAGDGGTAAVRDLPGISSCDQVAAVVGDYIDGIPLEKENSYVQPDAIGCGWVTPADAVSELSDIQSFTVDISEGMDEVPDADEAAGLGMDMYFDDPRLEKVGGVGLWMDADSAAVRGGTGSVLVPGVDIVISDSRWGQDGRLTKDSLVSVALALLDL
ncbi:hypothetical protein OHB93_04190 [Microbacterium sp. No. 7]|uniref:hypothetical protein n=1 Tax=Microbacterium sp. No. 7 TaxID=1714373 RepID=UPI00300835A4